MVWSPPSVMTRGRVLPFLAGPRLVASVAGLRERMLKCPSSICLRAHELSYLLLRISRDVVVSPYSSVGATYEVTGISPQSRTVAQLLNGLVARGTL